MSKIEVDQLDPQSGTNLTVGTSGDTIKTGTGTSLVVQGDGSSANGIITLNCSQNSHGIKLSSPDHSGGQSYTMKFPATNITAGKFLKVDSISGSGATAIGQLSFADEPGGGKVLQVVDVSTESQVATSSTSYVAVSGMTLNITPSATTSKILLIHSANVQAGAAFYGYYTIYRDSTDISVSHADRGLGSLYSSQGTQALPMHFSKLDSPNTTSQITYTVRFRSSDGTTMHYGEPDGTTTTLIAMEIGA